MNDSTRKTTGPAPLYPELGGTMQPRTILMPPDMIAFGHAHPEGLSGCVRAAMLALMRKAGKIGEKSNKTGA